MLLGHLSRYLLTKPQRSKVIQDGPRKLAVPIPLMVLSRYFQILFGHVDPQAHEHAAKLSSTFQGATAARRKPQHRRYNDLTGSWIPPSDRSTPKPYTLHRPIVAVALQCPGCGGPCDRGPVHLDGKQI